MNIKLCETAVEVNLLCYVSQHDRTGF